VDALVRKFTESEFQFARAKTNEPFLPLAWVNVAGYGEANVRDSGLPTAALQQSSLSEGAFLPLPLGKRDLIVIGEWASFDKFDLKNVGDDLEVVSVAPTFGWARQLNQDWQLAAFAAPLGHRSPKDNWYWETLGGVFTRYTQSDRLAWIFGGYFDVSSFDKFYVPYIGLTYSINERWTTHIVMPWPDIAYAPNERTLVRLGVSPTGASWVDTDGKSRVSVDAWNFGLSAQRRIHGNLWLGAEVGISGIRGLSIVGGQWEGVDTKLSRTGYALLTFNYRPPDLSE
jgi:hypothetical protein